LLTNQPISPPPLNPQRSGARGYFAIHDHDNNLRRQSAEDGRPYPGFNRLLTLGPSFNLNSQRSTFLQGTS
jgi:hypothetical protein